MMLELYVRFSVLATPAAERLNAHSIEVNVCHQELCIVLGRAEGGKR
jgi:hypothetical protein